jgi:acylphosphatase
MALVHKNITIQGKVQGVYFRASAKHIADQSGVKGIVQNKPGGAVYAEAEGEADAVEKFISWCNTGPAAAKVSSVEVTDGLLKGYKDFNVIR